MLDFKPNGEITQGPDWKTRDLLQELSEMKKQRDAAIHDYAYMKADVTRMFYERIATYGFFQRLKYLFTRKL